MLSSWQSLVVLLYLLVETTKAVLTNRTIDDQNGDSVTGALPKYSPPGVWNQGNGCGVCALKLDPTQTVDGSWHDTQVSPNTTVPRTITVQFNGSAIYAYCVIPNTLNSTALTTNMTFTLDGNYVDSYFYVGNRSTDPIYNVPVYANHSLSNGGHTFVIEATPGPFAASTVLFDYVKYTVDDGSPKSKTGLIVGSTLGTFTGVVLVIFITFYLIRRQHRMQRAEDEKVTAYPTYRAFSAPQHLTDRRILSRKAMERQAELDRLESTLSDLRSDASSSPTQSTSRISAPLGPSSSRRENTESELADQIAQLRLEIANMHSQPSPGDTLDYPPPQYHTLPQPPT